jgi:hypothetical protein
MKTTPRELADPHAYAHRLAKFAQTGVKALVVVIDAGPLYDEMARTILAAGIPVFRSADEAVTILSRWASRAPGGRPNHRRSERLSNVPR